MPGQYCVVTSHAIERINACKNNRAQFKEAIALLQNAIADLRMIECSAGSADVADVAFVDRTLLEKHLTRAKQLVYFSFLQVVVCIFPYSLFLIPYFFFSFCIGCRLICREFGSPF